MMVQRGIEAAMRATAAMQRQGTMIELDASVARDAGRLGVELKMPMADSIVYATARALDGVVWTQDSDFQNLPLAEDRVRAGRGLAAVQAGFCLCLARMGTTSAAGLSVSKPSTCAGNPEGGYRRLRTSPIGSPPTALRTRAASRSSGGGSTSNWTPELKMGTLVP